MSSNNILDEGLNNLELAFEYTARSSIGEEKNITNPFFISVAREKPDAKEIYGHPRMLVMCLTKGAKYSDDMEIFKTNLTLKDFKKQSKQFILLEGSMKLLKNSFHFNNALVVKKDFLEPFNHNEYVLNSEELITLLVDINEVDAKQYIDTYVGYTFSNFFGQQHINNFYNGMSSYYLKLQSLQYLQNISDAKYWENPNNCRINFTNYYKRRDFTKKSIFTSKMKIEALALSEAKLTSDNFVQREKKALETAYEEGDTDSSSLKLKKDYIDISSALSDGDFRLYRVPKPNKLSRNVITRWFECTLDESLRFHMFNSLLLSKENCHLAINNKEVLKIMKPTIASAMPFYRYILGYTWLYLYFEESIKKTYATQDDRFVFDIDTAYELPVFAFCPEEPNMNPYTPVMVAKRDHDLGNNFMGLYMMSNYDGYGIDNLAGWRKKFNIFTTGREDVNIFDGLDWTHFAVGGSIVQACAHKRHPTTMLVKRNSDLETYNYYFNTTYESSDLDVMCNIHGSFEYMDKVQDVADLVEKNLSKLVGKEVDVNIAPKKRTLTVTAHVDYLKKEFGSQYDDIIKNLETDDIKELFYEIYFVRKMKKNKKHRKEHKMKPLYKHFYRQVAQENMTIIITTDKLTYRDKYEDKIIIKMSEVDPEIKKEDDFCGLVISESLRFGISSPHMNHPFEIFRTRYDNFFSTVGNFHFPCVREYYNGKKVYLFPSTITSIMTSLNLDYKYIAGTYDPSVVLMKYRKYGYGALINRKERTYVTKYCKGKPEYNWMFSKKNPLRPLTLEEKIFSRDPGSVEQMQQPSYIKSVHDVHAYYLNKHGYDESNSDVRFLGMRTIDDMGNVLPLKPWIINAAREQFILNKKVYGTVPKKPKKSTLPARKTWLTGIKKNKD